MFPTSKADISPPCSLPYAPASPAQLCHTQLFHSSISPCPILLCFISTLLMFLSPHLSSLCHISLSLTSADSTSHWLYICLLLLVDCFSFLFVHSFFPLCLSSHWPLTLTLFIPISFFFCSAHTPAPSLSSNPSTSSFLLFIPGRKMGDFCMKCGTSICSVYADSYTQRNMCIHM